MTDKPGGVKRKDGEPTTEIDEREWVEQGPKRHRVEFEGVEPDATPAFQPSEGEVVMLGPDELPSPEILKKNLTGQQLKFIDHLFDENMDWDKAAVLAGYRGNIGSTVQRLRSTPLIAMLVLHRLETMRSQQRVTLEKVEDMLVDEAMDKRDIKSNSQSARVGALGTLARLKGGFEKGQAERARPVAVNIDFDDILGVPETTVELQEGDDTDG